MQPRIPVAFVPCRDYDGPALSPAAGPEHSRALSLAEAVDEAFALAGYTPARGERVLVKPNLLRADALSCTSPQVARAVCQWLLDRGAAVSVGDSPGFGSAAGVARRIGLTGALADLRAADGRPIVPVPLDKAVTRHIPGLGPVKLSRRALEADSILSLPRLKAHCQAGVTGAAKNLFGCVCGTHKAIIHMKHGDNGPDNNDFCRYIAGLTNLLPPQAALVDAVTCMHVTGPSRGQPYHLGLIAASTSCAAVDTALYGLLGLDPDYPPLWRALRELNVPGAFPQDIVLRGAPPESFDAAGFITPHPLLAQSFRPWRLCLSAFRRFWARLSV